MDVRLPSWRFRTLFHSGRHRIVLFGLERHMCLCPPSPDKPPAKTPTSSINEQLYVVAAGAVILNLGHGLPVGPRLALAAGRL